MWRERTKLSTKKVFFLLFAFVAMGFFLIPDVAKAESVVDVKNAIWNGEREITIEMGCAINMSSTCSGVSQSITLEKTDWTFSSRNEAIRKPIDNKDGSYNSSKYVIFHRSAQLGFASGNIDLDEFFGFYQPDTEKILILVKTAFIAEYKYAGQTNVLGNPNGKLIDWPKNNPLLADDGSSLCFDGEVIPDESIKVKKSELAASGSSWTSNDGVWIVMAGTTREVTGLKKDVELSNNKLKYSRICYVKDDFKEQLRTDTEYQLRYYKGKILQPCDGQGDASQAAGQTSTENRCEYSFAGNVKFKITLENNKYFINILQTVPEIDPTPNAGDKIEATAANTHSGDWLNIPARQQSKDPFDILGQALQNAINFIAGYLDGAISVLSDIVNKMINAHEIAPNENNAVLAAWKVIRNLSLTLLAIGIIVIAFANILSIDIERWGVQRMIPKLVIAVVLTYFSYFIAQVLVDFASVLSAQLFGLMEDLKGSPTTGIDAGKFHIQDSIANSAATTFGLILVSILLIIVLIYLAILLIMRVFVINFLIVIAPMAFILGILPFTENLYKQWWSEFTKWVFMGPAIMFMIFVGNVITSSAVHAPSLSIGGYDKVFAMLMAVVAYFLAAQIPAQMGGKAMSTFGSIVKKRAQGMWGVRHAREFAKQRSVRTDERANKFARNLSNKIGQSGFLGRRVVNANKNQAKAMREALIADQEKEFESLGLGHQAETLGNLMNDKNKIKAQAAARLSAAYGNLDTAILYKLGTKGKESAAKDAWGNAKKEGKSPEEVAKLEENYRQIAKENRAASGEALGAMSQNDTTLFKRIASDFTDLGLMGGEVNGGLGAASSGKRKATSLSAVKGGVIDASMDRDEISTLISNGADVDEIMQKGTAGAKQALRDYRRRFNSGQLEAKTDSQKLLMDSLNNSEFFRKLDESGQSDSAVGTSGRSGGGGSSSSERVGRAAEIPLQPGETISPGGIIVTERHGNGPRE